MKKKDIFFISIGIVISLILAEDMTIFLISHRVVATVLGIIILFMAANHNHIIKRINPYIFLTIFPGCISFAKIYYSISIEKKLLILPVKNITNLLLFENYMLSIGILLFTVFKIYNQISKRHVFHTFSIIIISFLLIMFNLIELVPIIIAVVSILHIIIKSKNFEKIEFVYTLTFLLLYLFSTLSFILYHKYNFRLYIVGIYYFKVSFYYFVLRLLAENKNILEFKELKDEKNKLIIMNEEKTKFLSLVTHDIRNMLQGIIGLCQLTKTLDENKIGKDLVDNIYQISLSMNSMLTDFLIWSKIDLKSDTINKTSFDINKLINKVANEQKFNADLKSIKIKYESDKEIFVYADINMIEVILRNIINNAIKFARVDTEIDISTEITNETITINIKDKGIKLTQEIIDEILNDKLKLSDPKSGFGLKIVKNFLERNNGKLFIKSDEKETNVSFNIPLNPTN